VGLGALLSSLIEVQGRAPVTEAILAFGASGNDFGSACILNYTEISHAKCAPIGIQAWFRQHHCCSDEHDLV